MNIFDLVLRSLAQRRLAAVLTSVSVALGVMLVVAILAVREELAETYERPGKGYVFVIGPPKGAELQLVLNSVYHLQQSAGLLAWSAYEEAKANRYARLLIPMAVGDSFRGHRVVATTDGIFSALFPHPEGTGQDKLLSGRPFLYREADLFEAFERLPGQRGKWTERIKAAREAEGDPAAVDRPRARHAEAVLGYNVQRKHAVRVNDKIEVVHGVEGGGTVHEHAHEWQVVGVLKPTGTPVDDVVFVNIDSFYRIADHVEGAVIPSVNEPGISSALVFPTPGVGRAVLGGYLRTRENLLVADVPLEVRRLLQLVGDVDQVFYWTALLVVVIGVSSILVAIYNTMNERRREIAILRALGASRLRVVLVIVCEAALLGLLGGLLGLALSHALLALVAEPLAEAARMQIDPLEFRPVEPIVLLAVTAASAVLGLIPAMKAYATDVASHLAPIS